MVVPPACVFELDEVVLVLGPISCWRMLNFDTNHTLKFGSVLIPKAHAYFMQGKYS